MTRKILLLAVLLMLCSACKSLHTIDGEYRFADSPGKGLIAISTRAQSNCGANSSITFNSLDRKENGVVLFENMLIPKDFQDPPGYFFVRALPAGDYVFSTVTVHTMHSVRSMNIPFTVIAGKAVYLGELSLSVPGCTTFSYAVSDQWERDRALFSQRIRNQNADDVQKQILPNRREPAL